VRAFTPCLALVRMVNGGVVAGMAEVGMTLREAGPATSQRHQNARRRAPVDMAHLERQTFGNQELQRRVLELFLRQSGTQIERLKAADTIGERREAAHAIVGAARAVGAFSVAYIASEIELSEGPVTGRLKALEAAAEAARDFIVRSLSR
jgi:HPt (histidine-containing phosphotransfer) domain-containing protein